MAVLHALGPSVAVSTGPNLTLVLFTRKNLILKNPTPSLSFEKNTATTVTL